MREPEEDVSMTNKVWRRQCFSATCVLQTDLILLDQAPQVCQAKNVVSMLCVDSCRQ